MLENTSPMGKFFGLLIADAIFIVAILALLFLLKGSKHATYAVMRRNFVSYFSSPTGYVFICVFMLLCSIAGFWPDAFFNENLATSGQLSRWFALIMLVYIPAVTMSIWAEERHEGTDELLLTMPASDLDIVLGKYLAAALIFTAALIMSQISNFSILLSLSMGDMDLGLFLTTYLGYWLLGLAMISIGMVASFLTSNLTVSFILGALLNAPLAFLQFVDWFLPSGMWAQKLSDWSFAARFRDFGRGVISLSSTFFFVGLILLGLYVSLILIGRRHWLGGRDGRSMLGHYIVRTLALVATVVGASTFIMQHDRIRVDTTSGKVSSLAAETKEILNGIKDDTNIVIDAFVSGNVPESFATTRVDLLNKLREFKAIAPNKIQLRLYDHVEPFSDDAQRAEEQYGIRPETVTIRDKGKFRDEEFILGAAISSGLERVVIPFFGNGVPVEYELIRSIGTVTGGKRKRLGVIQTDAQLFGGFDMSSMQPRPKQRIVTELEKQYAVESVDPASPVAEDRFDVLLVVQPSSLGPSQLDNLIAAIRNGTPTAIFEDPFPYAFGAVPGTGDPKAPRGNPMFGGGMPPEPKGDITKLWKALGIEMVGTPSPTGEGYNAHVVFQAYNPYPKLDVALINNEWVFVSPDAPGADPETLNVEDDVSSGLKEILCIYPGAVRNLDVRGIRFTPLMKTTEESGWINPEDLRMARGAPQEIRQAEQPSSKRYVIAARIQGRAKDEIAEADASAKPVTASPPTATPTPQVEPTKENASPSPSATTAAVADAVPNDTEQKAAAGKDEKARELHVIYVGDIDILSGEFLEIRERPDEELNWRFENVTFVLNAIDSLAGEKRLVSIRKRQPRHGTLKLIDVQTEDARTETQNSIKEFSDKFEAKLEEIKKEVEKEYYEARDKVNALKEKIQSGDPSASMSDYQREAARLQIIQQVAEKRVQVEKDRLEREQNREIEKINMKLEREVKAEQAKYKRKSIYPALFFPLVVGVGMWLIRNLRENEGASAERTR
jgi:ABC-2 type transport system permease protein